MKTIRTSSNPASRLTASALAIALGLAAWAAGPGLSGVAPAFAVSLDQARAAGQVCEAPDGLLRATGGGGDVQSLVSQVNAERMQIYQQSAQKEGVPIAQIQAVSGAKLRGRYTPCP